MSVGSIQKARVFLDGREVPFVQASLTAAVNQTMNATIELVPLQRIKFILPRTPIQIYLQDPKNFGDYNFYSVFDGEVVGRSMMKRQDGRAFSVMAVDYTSYWDDADLYVTSPNFTVGMAESVVNLQSSPQDEIVKALAGKVITTSSTGNVKLIQILTASGNKDFATGCVNIVKNLGNTTQYYKAAYERLRIADRLNVFSSGNLEKFLEEISIDEFLESYTGMHGGQTSLRELMTNMMGMIFHQFVSIPFPAKLPDGKSFKINNYMFVPDGYTLPPPMCNVIFPNQQQGYQFQEDFRATPTRYMFRAGMPSVAVQGQPNPSYSTQFYPSSFSDYMSKGSLTTAAEKKSLLGPSSVLTDPKSGRSYAQIFYGDPSAKAVGSVSAGSVLRVGDFMTNEESFKGIFLASDTFMPSYIALTRTTGDAARIAFTQEIGAYQFYKKRYEQRAVTAELIFNPFLVPGFNTVFLDDSAAGQSFIARLDSVTHIISNSGCATTVGLSHGRDFDEIDLLSGGQGEPPTPKWFDNSIFGSKDDSLFKKETDYLLKVGALKKGRDDAEIAARSSMTNATVYPNLSKFYQTLLGAKAITDYTANTSSDTTGKKVPSKPQLVTPRGAVTYLLDVYRRLANDPVARDAKVAALTRRPVPTMVESFAFLRAVPIGKSGKVPAEFAVFVGSSAGDLPKRFDGKGYADEQMIKQRRAVIDDYVALLKSGVGFRG